MPITDETFLGLTDDQWLGVTDGPTGDWNTAMNPVIALNSLNGVTRTGASATAWGDATGGGGMGYSDDPADLINGWPLLTCNGVDEWFELDELVPILNGNEPNFTLGLLFRINYMSSSDVMLSTGNAGQGRFMAYAASASNMNANRKDDSGTNEFFGGTGYTGSEAVALIVQSVDGTGSIITHNVATGAENTNSQDISTTDAITFTVGALGCERTSGGQSNFFRGGFAKVEAYDTAVSTSDLMTRLLAPAGAFTSISQGKLSGIIGRPLRGLIG